MYVLYIYKAKIYKKSYLYIFRVTKNDQNLCDSLQLDSEHFN